MSQREKVKERSEVSSLKIQEYQIINSIFYQTLYIFYNRLILKFNKKIKCTIKVMSRILKRNPESIM